MLVQINTMNMTNNYLWKYKFIIREILLVLTFLLGLMISTISNYNYYYLFVKTITTALLLFALFIDVKKIVVKHKLLQVLYNI